MSQIEDLTAAVDQIVVEASETNAAIDEVIAILQDQPDSPEIAAAIEKLSGAKLSFDAAQQKVTDVLPPGGSIKTNSKS